MTLKEIINQVLGQTGFLQRTAFASSTDPDDLQMVTIANEVVDYIKEFYMWPVLRKDNVIEIASGQSVYAMPSDFDGYVPNSGWTTDGGQKVELPVPDDRWYMYKNSVYSDGSSIKLRLKGNQIEVANAEDHVGEQIQFSYLSNWLVFASNGSGKTLFTADTDTFILDDMLLVMGLKAFWTNTKKMPTAQGFMVAFMRKLNTRIGKAKGGGIIGGVKQAGSSSPYYPLHRPS